MNRALVLASVLCGCANTDGIGLATFSDAGQDDVAHLVEASSHDVAVDTFIADVSADAYVGPETRPPSPDAAPDVLRWSYCDPTNASSCSSEGRRCLIPSPLTSGGSATTCYAICTGAATLPHADSQPGDQCYFGERFSYICVPGSTCYQGSGANAYCRKICFANSDCPTTGKCWFEDGCTVQAGVRMGLCEFLGKPR